MILPSKELLSEVLEFEITNIPQHQNSKKLEFYSKVHSSKCIFEKSGDLTKGSMFSINIYELMHMMKEWAVLKYGIEISSTVVKDNGGIYSNAYTTSDKDCISFDANDNLEPEAVTRACEWILKEIQK